MFIDEEDIERTLKAALNLEPSAGFEDQVRQRVQDTSRARRFPAVAWLAAAAAAALMAGGWFVAQRVSDRQVPLDPATMADGTSRAPATSLPVPDHPPAPAEEQVPVRPEPDVVRVPSPANRQIARRAEPEVLVPAGQLELVRRLVRQAEAASLELPEPAEPGADSPSPLIIEPVVIEPIPVVSPEPASIPLTVLKGIP